MLHTWTRELLYHPHVHCLVTGGGLARDGARWVAARRKHARIAVCMTGPIASARHSSRNADAELFEKAYGYVKQYY